MNQLETFMYIYIYLKINSWWHEYINMYKLNYL